MGVVPKLWKKLIVTFIWANAMLLAYHVIVWSALNLRVIIENTFLLAVLSIAYALGFMYIIMAWDMANVVSVLEDVYVIKAIMKSNGLIKHNIGTVVFISYVIVYFYLVLQLPILLFVMFDVVVRERVLRIGIGVAYFSLMSMVVMYFVCNSNVGPHENIDKSFLAEHLQAYLGGECAPLKINGDVEIV
ncbi:hypothetical protein ACJRO7_033536 [Eucalyptus globulus]|uniref:Transmembrane protein n=1 Tax=Eucalyptus globulus TaxID=34317 RepID=A0ABD3JT51_EUCGL